jgi:hypothetical protein
VKRTDITLATARAHLKSPHPRIFISQSLVYWTAAVTVSAVWAVILSFFLSPWLAVLGGVAGAATLPFLWGLFGVAFHLQSGLTRVQRMVRGWLTAVVVLTVFGALITPWWGALVAGAVGLALSPLAFRATRRIEGSKMKALELPAELQPALEKLPPHMPGEVEAALEIAFRDWAHLRELLGYSTDSALRSYVDTRALDADALTTLLYVFERAPLVSKLVQVARERGDDQSQQVAQSAVQRLRNVGDALHDAVAAAIQYAASEKQEQAYLLKARVESLRNLAESLDVDVLESGDPEAKWRQLPRP